MIKKSQRKEKESLPKQTAKKRDHFDQEEENLDMLEMEEHNDQHYNALLKSSPHANLKKNAYFFKNQRYSATKQPQPEEEPQAEEEADSQPQKNYLAQALRDLKKQRVNKSKLLTEDVRKIQQEDQEFETIRKQHKTSQESIMESVCLKGQLDLFKDLIDYRYNKQNQLEMLKKFPIANHPKSTQLNQSHKQLESHIVDNLNNLIELYKQYSAKVFGKAQVQSFQQALQNEVNEGKQLSSCRLSVQSMHQKFSQSQQPIVRQAEKQLVKWSQKTTLLNLSSSHYSSLLMQTPVGQAKKIVQQWARASSKCQQKRGTFKILFEKEEDIRNSSNPQIFDDFQLFNQLQKIYVSEVQDENDFRISDTLRYLKNREARGQKSKQVDRKASKNRKLRFNVHPKLLNFIPSRPANEIQARDQIVQNIFNCKSGQMQHKGKQEETYYIDI